MRPELPLTTTAALALALLGLGPGCLVDEAGYHGLADSLVDDDGDGYTENDGDCADNDPDVFPGQPELCNGIDDDCDGQADEDPVSPLWYADLDDDGFGDPTTAVAACTAPTGFVADATDCDDTTGDVSPDAEELCNDIDDDCDGDIDIGATDATATWYLDLDGDGFGTDDTEVLACTQPGQDWVTAGGDCDDDLDHRYPGADELCNDLDDDCDDAVDEEPVVDPPTWYFDNDLDGFGTDTITLVQCAGPEGYANIAGDCDDDLDTRYPGADEYCNGIDDDCDDLVDEEPTVGDGTWYLDSDGDGWGDGGVALETCTPPDDYVLYDGDCDDSAVDVNPDAVEACNDRVDNDCDGSGNECTWADAISLGEVWRIQGYGHDGQGATFGRRGTTGDLDADGLVEIIWGGESAVTTDDGEMVGFLRGHESPVVNGDDYSDAQLLIWGESAFDYFGYDSAVVDANADGFDDLMVGSSGLTLTGADYAGGAYLIYGPISNGEYGVNDLYDWRVAHESEWDFIGDRVYSLPDYDGDGKGDFAVGSPAAAVGGESYRGLFLFFSEESTSYETTREAAFAVIEGESDDNLALDAASVDIDCDGVSEFVTGSKAAEVGGEGRGAVFAFEAADLDGTLSTEDYAYRWYGEWDGSETGTSVENVGDVNGDGTDDLGVGAPGFGAGDAYVIVTGSAVVSGSLADANVALRGTYGGSRHFGAEVWAAGDQNEDGHADFMVAEYGYNANAYLYYGPISASVVLNDTDADVELQGDDSDYAYEDALAPGDLTGDGVPDIAIGSYMHDEEYSNAGVVYVIPGIGM